MRRKLCEPSSPAGCFRTSFARMSDRKQKAANSIRSPITKTSIRFSRGFWVAPKKARLRTSSLSCGRSKVMPEREGTIHVGDCLFLTAFVSILAPSRAIEIGTLGGFSAAVIAAAIRRQHPDEKRILVETIDRNTHSLLEPDKAVGFLLRDMFPAFAEAVRVHVPADSGIVHKFAAPDEIEFAFIDADHQHPRPLLDLVRLGPVLRSGAWVVFHDVRLGTHTAEKGDLASLAFGAPFGAECFFENWPFRKISGGNIGAVQIPADKSAMVAPALRLMDLPFEVNPGDESRRDRRALHQNLVQLW